MADEHRRVEPNSIVGTGMRTDPERIREVEDEQERILRRRREKPRRGFGDVLESAPAWHGDEEEEEPARRASPAAEAAELEPESDADDAAAAEERGSAPAPVALDAEPAEKALPRVPPDPRVAQLNRMLDGGQRPSTSRPESRSDGSSEGGESRPSKKKPRSRS